MSSNDGAAKSYSLDLPTVFCNDSSSQFIDINIDSDVEESLTSGANKKEQRGTFGMKKKSSEPAAMSRKQTPNRASVDICESSFTSTANVSMAMKTDLILSNLSDIGLTDLDDDDDEDDDDQEDELNKKNYLLDENNNSFVSEAINSTPLHSISLEKLNIDDTINNSTLNGSESPSKTLSLDESSMEASRKKKQNDDPTNPIWRSLSLNTPPSRLNNTRLRNYVHLKNMVSSISAVRNDSLVDGLLGDIYDRFNISSGGSQGMADSDVFTEMSASSSRLSGGDSTADHEYETRYYSKNSKLARSHLQQFSITELKNLISEMTTKNSQMSAKLIRELKKKDKLASKLNRNCDLLTALLQAKSLKRRVDTQMKFTLNPMPGEAGFAQWKDAMKALARLPGGVPKEFRRSLWLNLAQKYIDDLQIDWPRVKKAAFNDRSNPDDDELGIQIVKDLHRTGCSTFSGHENERDRALLKRVLLAYARYNKSVGYCQGFNIIAALILEIVDKREEDALVCMIYLIDHILPEGYFTNSMHSLAIDMAIFRELLKQKHPKLHGHLNELQFGSSSSSTSTSPTHASGKKKQVSAQPSVNTYEPPLTNVFTMQWFLTLFATCLPKNVLLRVWDSIFLDGAEILFRTAIAIWDKLSVSIMKAHSADSFYSMMSVLSLRLLDQNAIDENDLVNKIYSYGPFPLPGLKELKEKFTFNIKPFISQDTASGVNKSKKHSTTIKLIDGEFDPSDSPDNSDSLRLRKTLDGDDEDVSSESDSVKTRRKPKQAVNSNEEDEIEDLAQMISCFALLMPNRSPASAITAGPSQSNTNNSQKDIMLAAAAAASTYGLKQSSNNPFSFLDRFVNNRNKSDATSAGAVNTSNDISSVTPGAFSYVTQAYDPKPLSEKLTTDLSELKKQYEKLKERQRQAYIIMQSASNQQRLNNMNNSQNNKTESSPSSTPSKTSKISNSSTSNTLEIGFGMLEKTPVVNHLLIKSNDPTRNTVKQTVQLVNDPENTQIIKEKLKQSNSIISQLLMDKKDDQVDGKQKNVYYSDDDDDDEDDEIMSDYDEESKRSRIYSSRTNKGGEDDLKLEEGPSKPRLSIDTVNRMNLIDLANIDEEPEVSEKNTLGAAGSSAIRTGTSPSSSSSSSMSSPVLSKAPLSQQQSQGSKQQQATVTRKVSSSSSSKKMSTSDVINNLINEEKRQAVPLNPFPTRQINSHVAKNGVRLGLYK